MSPKSLVKARSRIPRFTLPQIFFVIGFLQAATVVSLYGYVFTKWQLYMRPNSMQVPSSLVIPTNLALLIFASVYELFVIGDAIYDRNSIQITAALFVNLGMIPQASLQINGMKQAIWSMSQARDINNDPLVNLDMDPWHEVRPTLIAIPIVLGVGVAAICVTAFFLMKHFSWMKYQQLNGDLEMRHRYLTYQAYVSILKVSFFMIIAFLTVYSVPVLQYRGWEFWANIGFVVSMILVHLAASYFVRKEFFPGMLAITAAFLATMAYFIYKMYLIHTPSPISFMFQATMSSLNLYATLSLLFSTLAFVCGILCMRNFGHGLRMYLGGKIGEAIDDGSDQYSMSDVGLHHNLLATNRMSRRLSLD